MADPAVLVITVDGTQYKVKLSQLTAIDAKDFRAAVGVSLAQAIAGGSGDLDVIAGLVWLARRKIERGLPYAKVAAALTYDSDIDLTEPDDAATPEDDPGEA